MSGFYSYDAWKTTPPPDEGDPSLCSECGEWAEWEEQQCPVCGYGEPDGTDEDEPDRDDAREAEREP